METVNVHEAKTHLSRLLARVSVPIRFYFENNNSKLKGLFSVKKIFYPRMLTNLHEFSTGLIGLKKASSPAVKLLSRDSGMKLSCLRSAGWNLTFFIRVHS